MMSVTGGTESLVTMTTMIIIRKQKEKRGRKAPFFFQLKKFLVFEIEVAIPTPTPKVSMEDPP